MDKVYITGHRNPDTDSIVSAMAYAALKNALGQRQYCAARLGQISDETQTVLDRFGVQPPELIGDVRTQVRDLAFDTPPTLSAAATISRGWQTMQAEKISAIPVTNEDAYELGREMGKVEGFLVGISAGAALWAAIELAKQPENEGKTIVALLPDTGDRYLSTPMFQV